MKVLILMSAWAKDNSNDSRLWIRYYVDLLQNIFPQDNKIISINCGSPDWVRNEFSLINKVSWLGMVPTELQIDSDASGFQTCLSQAKERVPEYDVVLFLHTKGASYSWKESESIRTALNKTIFNRDRLVASFSTNKSQLVADRGHLPQTPRSWQEVSTVAKLLNLPEYNFCFAATFTLYAVTAKRLSEVLSLNGNILLNRNLAELGFNRFFFEGAFPSVLSHDVDTLHFLGGAEFQVGLSQAVSADAFPLHNSKMVLREFSRFQIQRNNFNPKAFPYLFGPAKSIQEISIQFDP